MKTAITSDGNLIEASSRAPAEAHCPYCAGKIVLRRRRRMRPSGVTYYWRHLDNRNRRCQGRTHPLTRDR